MGDCVVTQVRRGLKITKRLLVWKQHGQKDARANGHDAALCEGARTERYLICRRIVESNISWRNPWQHEGAKTKAQKTKTQGKGVKGSSVERSKNEKAKNFVGQEFRAHLFVGLFKLGRSAN